MKEKKEREINDADAIYQCGKAESEPSPIIQGLGGRIKEIADRLGGAQALSDVTGISEAQIYRYISEKSDPTFKKAALIAAAGCVSLEWLALGEASESVSSESIDLDALKDAIAMVEDGLNRKHMTMTTTNKAKAVAQAYLFLKSKLLHP